MKTTLTLQEKLRDLRDEQGLTLSMLAGKTGIPLSTLQRTEGKEDMCVGYQDVAALAKFYCVSTDYLFGLTDNRQHRNVEIDTLNLSDEAIAELQSGKLNNKLLCEIITHPDFADLLAGLEVFLDRTVSIYIEAINKTYRVARDKIALKKIAKDKRDEYLAALREGSIDPDAYFRVDLSRRFESLVQKLYDRRHVV